MNQSPVLEQMEQEFQTDIQADKEQIRPCFGVYSWDLVFLSLWHILGTSAMNLVKDRFDKISVAN